MWPVVGKELSAWPFTCRDGEITVFCALDSGLLLVRKADSYTCLIELEANLLHDSFRCALDSGFLLIRKVFLYVFDRAGSQSP